MIHHYKALVLYFQNLPKNSKFAKIKVFFCKIQLYSKNVKLYIKNDKLYIFEKHLTMPFQICKKCCKIFNNLMCNKEKLKMCKFLLTGCLQIICKTCAIRFLMSQAFQKVKFYQNLTTESGPKQRFSLLQEKVIIQTVCLRLRQLV